MITSENHQEIVSTALRDILNNEFVCDVIQAASFDNSRLTKGEYIRFWFIPSELANAVHAGEYRTYNIEICYYFDEQRKRSELLMNDITAKVERMKQLFIEHYSYIPGNVYKWHYLTVGNVQIDKASIIEDIENIEDVMLARLEIQITRGNF